MITVAITSFNRGDLVCRAIASALSFVRPIGGRVVVVDDGSPEPIFPFIFSAFPADLETSALTHIRSDLNTGVTAAKNLAFLHSDSGWVLFLDSDDELIPTSAANVANALASRPGDALMFFRCIDQDGNFLGQWFDEPQALTLPRYLVHTSYGEALVAVNKAVTQDPPFDPDLRGYEGMGCARLIQKVGPVLLMPIVARRYHRVGDDRLSTFSGVVKRSTYLCRGHLRYVRLFGEDMSPFTRSKYRAKAAIYFMLSALRPILRQ